jgi:hypothetical protein
VGQKQINVRLPAEDVRVLEAASFLHDQSIAEYLKPVLLELIRELRKDPLVRQMLETKAVAAARREGSVAVMESARRRGRPQ